MINKSSVLSRIGLIGSENWDPLDSSDTNNADAPASLLNLNRTLSLVLKGWFGKYIDNVFNSTSLPIPP